MPADTRTWEGIRARVAELGRANVRAGVVGPAAHRMHPGTELTNGELALLHEYGNEDRGGHLKERSFVRSTVRDPQTAAEFASLTARIVRAVIDGKMSRDRGLALLGAWMAARIQKRIADGDIAPPDAPATVEAKGTDTVLVETGQLVAAVGWEVVK